MVTPEAAPPQHLAPPSLFPYVLAEDCNSEVPVGSSDLPLNVGTGLSVGECAGISECTCWRKSKAPLPMRVIIPG